MSINLSIIIPIYNVEKYLQRCLDSVLNQTLQNIEIICVDDGSCDNSIAILNEYAAKDSRIKVITQKNFGQGAARNVGIKQARGEYLAFLDADDWIEENFCEEMYNTANKKSAEIVGSYLVVHDKRRKKKSKIVTNKIFKTFEDKIRQIHNGSACDKIFSCNLIKNYNIKFPEGMYYEDNLFVIKALYYSKNFVYTDKTAYNYFYHEQSTTHKKENLEELKKSQIKVLNDIFSFAQQVGFSEAEIFALKKYVGIGFVNFEYLQEGENIQKIPQFLREDKYFMNLGNSIKYTKFIERIFSIKKTGNKKYKIVTALGVKFRIKRYVKC